MQTRNEKKKYPLQVNKNKFDKVICWDYRSLEEMQAIANELKKVKKELDAPAYDGPISEGFHKVGKLSLVLFKRSLL